MAKVLIVDDEAANRLLLRTILEFGGHDVFEAGEGDTGLRVAREVQPHLIIIDLYMPGMNGASFLKALRADAAIANTKVALYTGTSMSVAMEGFMTVMKIEHVIPKPSEPAEILRIVNAAIEVSSHSGQ